MKRLQFCILVLFGSFVLLAQAQVDPVSNASAPRTSDVQIAQLRVSHNTLGKRGRSNIHFALDNRNQMVPMDWEMTCSGVDIEGWKSSLPIRVLENDKVTGKPKVIGGTQFTPGKSVTVHVRRRPETKAGDAGECKITATAVFGIETPDAPSSHTRKTVAFKFK